MSASTVHPESNVRQEESYMSKNQLAYFKNKLICRKMKLLEKIEEVKLSMRSRQFSHADILDRSNSLMALERQVRNQDRYHHLVQQIEAALARIDNGSFGYCKITGNKIGLKRLEAIPFTAISIEALDNI